MSLRIKKYDGQGKKSSQVSCNCYFRLSFIAIVTYFMTWKSVMIDPAVGTKPLFKDFTRQKQEDIHRGKSDKQKPIISG
ncbi:hypothetical protein [uncultured Chryseobacterium sp.]|uniref:hypothetical protein n=1 Tax=uncultured Chryseobacterium sp. TaxID=259322 RepID=UPI0025D8C07D|nr:hypothetical protein [uncultured Chryseobacterium sp.]